MLDLLYIRDSMCNISMQIKFDFTTKGAIIYEESSYLLSAEFKERG